MSTFSTFEQTTDKPSLCKQRITVNWIRNDFNCHRFVEYLSIDRRTSADYAELNEIGSQSKEKENKIVCKQSPNRQFAKQISKKILFDHSRDISSPITWTSFTVKFETMANGVLYREYQTHNDPKSLICFSLSLCSLIENQEILSGL